MKHKRNKEFQYIMKSVKKDKQNSLILLIIAIALMAIVILSRIL